MDAIGAGMIKRIVRSFGAGALAALMLTQPSLAQGIIGPLQPPPPDSPTTVLHGFGWDGLGAQPFSGPVMDQSGALYGTTYASGGNLTDSVVFKLTPPGPGGQVWTKTILGRFSSASLSGTLIFDQSGALYGTGIMGGASNGGYVFKLTPPAPGSGTWSQTILYNFGGSSGARPYGGVILGQDGALYGTASEGGSAGVGTVFKLTPPATGQTWTPVTLHNFGGGSDGATPFAGLVKGPDGSLYGTTSAGGSFNQGTAFKLAPPASGSQSWTKTILHNFGASGDGTRPDHALIIDEHGALYGTTNSGGHAGVGIVFKLTPPAVGSASWTETILHSFAGSPNDGGYGSAGELIALRNGVLYGATAGGGANMNCNIGCGTIFKLVPPAPGNQAWTETVLFDFRYIDDPIYPVGALISDANGFLYGASFYGGEPGWGSVYAFRPFFTATAITSTTSTSPYANRPSNVFAFPGVKGESTWYAYGRVMELASWGDLSYDLLTKMPAAFATSYAPNRRANQWPDRLPGHWIATDKTTPLPVERRRIGLLAVYEGPLPAGHVGFVEEISLDKKRFRMSEFDRAGQKEYSNNWYYFDSADGTDASLPSKNSQIKRRWYPKFIDPGDPNW